MYIPVGISERDYTQTSFIKHYRYYNCSNINLFKSEYIKQSYSNLLFTNENNKNYYKKIIQLQNYKYIDFILYTIKLIIQYAELIKHFIDELENIKIDEYKYDIILLYWIHYKNYDDALNLLIYYKNNNNLVNYDILNIYKTIHYKTNISALQFVYAKIDNNLLISREQINYDLIILGNLIIKYIQTTDNNIFTNIKNLEYKYTIK